jgi:hypothetical protein
MSTTAKSIDSNMLIALEESSRELEKLETLIRDCVDGILYLQEAENLTVRATRLEISPFNKLNLPKNYRYFGREQFVTGGVFTQDEI